MHICHYREVVSYFNLLKYLRENSKIREGNSFKIRQKSLIQCKILWYRLGYTFFLKLEMEKLLLIRWY
jgi:hypothetical protein